MKKIIKNHWDEIIIGILFIYFLFQVIYLVFNTLPVPIGLFPDDRNHIKQIQIFYNTEQTPFSSFLTAGRPFYYFILGKLLHFNDILKINEYLFLKGINTLFSIGYLFVFFKLLKLLNLKKIVKVLAFVIQTNLLMFVFLSAGVSYDNLQSLLSISAIYFLVNFLKTKKFINLLRIITISALGVLTKKTFLPLLLGIFLVLIWSYRKEIFHLNLKKTKAFQKNLKKQKIGRLSYIISIITSIICISWFSHNFSQYGTIFPSCTDTKSFEECSKSGLFNRSQEIKKQWEERRLNGNIFTDKQINPYEYTKKWVGYMKQRILGITGARSIYQNENQLFFINILIWLAFILFVRKFSFKKEKTLGALFFIFAIYALTLLIVINYKSYIISTQIDIGMQGRYLFPVLFIFIILFSHALLNYWKNNWIKIQIFLLTSITFIQQCFPFYYYHPSRLNYYESHKKGASFMEQRKEDSLLLKNQFHLNQNGWLGPIYEKNQFKQGFLAKKNNLIGVQLKTATYKNIIETDYKFILKNEKNEIINEVLLKKEHIKDVGVCTIKFSSQEKSKDKKFFFTLEPVMIPVKAPITIGKISSNLYKDGQLYLNNIVNTEDILFNLLYDYSKP